MCLNNDNLNSLSTSVARFLAIIYLHLNNDILYFPEIVRAYWNIFLQFVLFLIVFTTFSISGFKVKLVLYHLIPFKQLIRYMNPFLAGYFNIFDVRTTHLLIIIDVIFSLLSIR